MAKDSNNMIGSENSWCCNYDGSRVLWALLL